MPDEPKRLRVLVVDDNDGNLYEAHKAYRGCRVELGNAFVDSRSFKYVSTAKEAIGLISAHDVPSYDILPYGASPPEIFIPDIVLTDFLFKGMDPALHPDYLRDFVGYVKAPADNPNYDNRIDRNIAALTTGKSVLEDVVRAYHFGYWASGEKPSVGQIADMLRKEIEAPGDRKELTERIRTALSEVQEKPDQASQILSAFDKWQTTEPQYGYGGLVMLAARQHGKPAVLVSDLHHHHQGSISLDGAVIVTPLTNWEIDVKSSVRMDADKTKPETWTAALQTACDIYRRRVEMLDINSQYRIPPTWRRDTNRQ